MGMYNEIKGNCPNCKKNSDSAVYIRNLSK